MPAELPDEIPKVFGHIVDEHGRKHVLHRGTLKHESLTPDQLQRIGRLRDVLIDAYPMTLDGWVDGFMRDAIPESEIRIVEACAAVYQFLATQIKLSTKEKQRVYGALIGLSAGVEPLEVASKFPKGRKMPKLDEIVTMLREAIRSGSRP